MDSKSGKREGHAEGPPIPIPHMRSVKMCQSTIMHFFRYNSQSKCLWTCVNVNFFRVLVCGTGAQGLSLPFSYNVYSEFILGHNASDKPPEWKRRDALPLKSDHCDPGW